MAISSAKQQSKYSIYLCAQKFLKNKRDHFNNKPHINDKSHHMTSGEVAVLILKTLVIWCNIREHFRVRQTWIKKAGLKRKKNVTM